MSCNWWFKNNRLHIHIILQLSGNYQIIFWELLYFFKYYIYLYIILKNIGKYYIYMKTVIFKPPVIRHFWGFRM